MKKPWLTALLNALIPGIGYLYLEKVGKALVAFVSVAVGCIFLPVAIILWIVWIIDGYFLTIKYNVDIKTVKIKSKSEKVANWVMYMALAITGILAIALGVFLIIIL